MPSKIKPINGIKGEIKKFIGLEMPKHDSKYKTKTVSIEEYIKLQEWYAEELKRRDKVIHDLREKNEVLLRTMIEQTDQNLKLKKADENIVQTLEKKRPDSQTL